MAADTLVIPADKLRVHGAGRATADGGWNLWSNAATGDWFDAAQAGEIEVVVSAAGAPCQGVFPLAQWFVRGEKGEEPSGEPFTVGSKDFKDYPAKVRVPQGRCAILLAFLNDAQAGGEDRNLLLKEFRFAGVTLADKVPPVNVMSETQRKLADEGVRKHRMGTLVVQTAPHAAVKTTMLRHEFLFGTALNWRLWDEKTPADIREKYQRTLRENFNCAVHENELKWYHTEREQGKPNYADAEKMLTWCEQNGIAMRGHCVFWGIEQYVQPWLKQLNDAALRAAMEQRAKDVATRFKGRIREYDLNNEMIHGDWYAKRLGAGITKEMFAGVKAADPDAILYVNDYSILSGHDGPRYIKHIQSLLDQGVPVGGIGCQGHFGAQVDPGHVRATLDALARFNLPIKITEFDMDTPDEQAKALGLEALYRTAFSHPAVAGLLMWGFWEGAHWKPQAAPWKKDFSPAPAAEVYRKLVRGEWWTRFEGQADAAGKCAVPAFFGKHSIEANGQKAEVELPKAKGTVVVVVGRQ